MFFVGHKLHNIFKKTIKFVLRSPKSLLTATYVTSL